MHNINPKPIIISSTVSPKTKFILRKVIPYLTKKYRVLAVDVRGFCDSERPISGYDRGTIASDLIAVANEDGFSIFRGVDEDWGAAYAYALAVYRVIQLVYQEMLLPGLG